MKIVKHKSGNKTYEYIVCFYLDEKGIQLKRAKKEVIESVGIE